MGPGFPRSVGPYRLVRPLGAGGAGAVFLVLDPLGREQALKVITQGGGHGEARFEVEAQAVARLRHPGIVAVHGAGRDPVTGQAYLVMDLVPGESLQAHLERVGPLEPRRAADLVRQVAEALEYAHGQGVLHRDLKPDNVLLTSDGRAVVTDFGLARILDLSQHLTRTGQLLGTPAFMPPEQMRGDRAEMGPPSDVYGCGATLYALLTGVPPFGGASPMQQLTAALDQPARPPSSLRAEVDRRLDAICLRCLAKAPRGRYPSAGALAEDLARYLRGEALEARVPSAWSRPAKAAALVVLAASCAAGVRALVASGHVTSPPPAPPVTGPQPASPSPPTSPRGRALDRVRQHLREGVPARALEALGSEPLSAAERAQLEGPWRLARDAALERGLALCGEAPLRFGDLAQTLELLARLGVGAEPPDPALADAVVLVAAALEREATEQLGDPRVWELVQTLARVGLEPRQPALVALMQEVRLSTRPRPDDFPQRAYALLLAFVELRAYVPDSLFQVVAWREWTDNRPSPRSPLEAYLQLRLLLPFLRAGQPDPQVARLEAMEQFRAGVDFAQLDPRTQAYLLVKMAEDEPRWLRKVALLREAEALAPQFIGVYWGLAGSTLVEGLHLWQRGQVDEARSRWQEARISVDRALTLVDPSTYLLDSQMLAMAAKVLTLVGEEARAQALIDSVPDVGDAQRRLRDARREAQALLAERGAEAR